MPKSDKLTLTMRTLITFGQRRGKRVFTCKELGERDNCRVTTEIDQCHLDLQGCLKTTSHRV